MIGPWVLGAVLAALALAWVLAPLFATEDAGVPNAQVAGGEVPASDDEVEAAIQRYRTGPRACLACGARSGTGAVYCSSCGRRLG